MRPVQPVLGPKVVIEAPDGPSTGVVASFATHTKSLFVFVVLCMAGHTIARRIFVTRCFMAAFAGHHHMPPSQREARKTVVEFGDFPRPVTVALLTLGALLPLVLVILLVAAKAVHGRVAQAL